MRRDAKRDRPPVEHRSNVFISGTYDDLAYIRREVAQAIARAGEAYLEPLDTAGANEDIREKIRRLIQLDAHLYVGVFGTRYGYRVSSEEGAESYTHFEYLEALKKWETESPPPIAVFMPDPYKGREFYQEVKARCDASSKAMYGDDPEALADDERRQQEFLEFVKRPHGNPRLGNRLVNYVATLQDLCFHVPIWIKNHKLETWWLWHETPPAPPQRAQPDSTKWSLQLEQVENVGRRVVEAASSRPVPGVCLLVHGERHHGQHELASLVAQSRCWDTEADPVLRVLGQPVDLNEQVIWRALWEPTGYAPHGDLTDTDELAKELLDADQPSVVVVRQVQLLKGRLRGFAERIWQPLYDSLLRASKGLAPAYLNRRLIVVLTYEGRDFEPEESISSRADSLPGAVDFRTIIHLAKVP